MILHKDDTHKSRTNQLQSHSYMVSPSMYFRPFCVLKSPLPHCTRFLCKNICLHILRDVTVIITGDKMDGQHILQSKHLVGMSETPAPTEPIVPVLILLGCRPVFSTSVIIGLWRCMEKDGGCACKTCLVCP